MEPTMTVTFVATTGRQPVTLPTRQVRIMNNFLVLLLFGQNKRVLIPLSQVMSIEEENAGIGGQQA